MSTVVYEPMTTLSGHRDTVIALEFSPDGKFLASGGQDGILLVFSTVDWRPIHKFVDTSPLLTLLWHPVLGGRLFCGFRSGDVHTLCLNGTTVNSYDIRLRNAHFHFLIRRVWRCGQTPMTVLFVA